MTDFATLAIRLTSDGSGKVRSDLRGVQTQAGQTEKSVESLNKMMNNLKRLLAVGLGIQGIGSLLQMADTMKSLNAQVRFVTGSIEEYNAVNKQLFDIAQKTRASLEATTTLYTRSARALKDYGYSQQRILTFTETLNKAMAVGGVGAQEQASALFQLSQALGSGRLQGDEFRTIAESAPIILDVVAEYMGKTRAEVKELASDGKITSQLLFEAISGASKRISEQFEGMPLTFGQSMQKMKNALLDWVSDLDSASGITGSLAQLISLLAENFSALAKALIYATTAYLAYSAIAKVQQFSMATEGVGLLAGAFGRLTTMIRTATAAMAANPIGLLAVAVVGLIYVWDQFISKMEIGFGSFNATWGDVATGIWLDFKDVAMDVWDSVSASVTEKISDLSQFFDVEIKDMGELVAKFANTLIGSWDFAYQAIMLTWDNFPAAMENLGVSAVNGLISLVEGAVNKILELVKFLFNKIDSIANTLGIESRFNLSNIQINLPKLNKSAAAKQYSQDLKDISQHVFSKDYLGNAKDYLMLAGMKGHIANNKDTNSPVDLSASGLPVKTPKTKSDKKKKKNTGSKTDRFGDMYNDYTSQIAQLKAESASIAQYGGVSIYKEYDQLMEKLKTDRETFKNMTTAQIEQLKKLAQEADKANMAKQVSQYAFNKKDEFDQMQFEANLLGKTAEEQERLNYYRKIDQEIKQLSIGMSDEYVQKLLAEGEAAKKNYEEIQKLKKEKQSDPIAGLRDGFDKFGKDAENIMGNVSNATLNAFNGMSDALTDLVMTGKADFGSLAKSIIKDIVQMTIKMAIFKAVSSMFGTGKSDGGIVTSPDMRYLGGLVGFDEGGFTGYGGKYQPAGIVHRGEYVITKEATSRIGVEYLNYLNYQSRSKPRGFANGGGVGVPTVHHNSGQPNIKVNVINNGEAANAKVESKQTDNGLEITVELLKAMTDIAEKAANNAITTNFRPGGAFA